VGEESDACTRNQKRTKRGLHSLFRAADCHRYARQCRSYTSSLALINKTILDQLADLSVECNGLLVPARSIQSVLGQYVFNLVVLNDDEAYKLSIPGSATAIRYRNRELLLTTRHQLSGFDESRVGMLTDTGGHAITSNGVRTCKIQSNTDASDISAFDFTEPCKEIPELKKRFFNLSERPPDILTDKIIAFVLAGFPSADQKYEIHESNHLGTAKRNIICLPESQPNDPALLTVEALDDKPFDPDGMSGGSAFVVQMLNGRPKAYFAGIVLRAGEGKFHILKVGFILNFLDNAFG
jgi:hypothetical protein